MAGIKFDVVEDFVRVSHDFPFLEVMIYPPEFIDNAEDQTRIGNYRIKLMKNDDTNISYSLNMMSVKTTWKDAEYKAKEAVINYFNELTKEIDKMGICSWNM